MATYYVDSAAGSDSNAGTSAGAGNAWQTIAKAFATATAGDLVNIKASASYVQTSTLALTNSGTEAAGPITYRGYTTTPGDGGQATITTATNSTVLIDASTKDDIAFESLLFSNTASIRSDGIRPASGYCAQWLIKNCTFDGFVNGIVGDNLVYFAIRQIGIVGCKFLNCSTGGARLQGPCSIVDSEFSGNQDGLFVYGVASVSRCVFDSNTRYGVSIGTSVNPLIVINGCVIRDNASDGVHIDDTSGTTMTCLFYDNNILWNNGGYGLNNVSTHLFLVCSNRTNAYGSNTSGSRNNLSAGTGDVTLTADPNTNAAGNDYSLNNTAGGGAACRAAGFPGTAPFGTGYRDIGPLQHQDAGGSTGAPLSRILTGM